MSGPQTLTKDLTIHLTDANLSRPVMFVKIPVAQGRSGSRRQETACHSSQAWQEHGHTHPSARELFPTCFSTESTSPPKIPFVGFCVMPKHRRVLGYVALERETSDSNHSPLNRKRKERSISCTLPSGTNELSKIQSSKEVQNSESNFHLDRHFKLNSTSPTFT